MNAREKILSELRQNQCADSECQEKQDNCYAGQWTIHGPHHYQLHRSLHLGGGIIQVHCPGKTAATKL